jgi:hypothetical protein
MMAEAAGTPTPPADAPQQIAINIDVSALSSAYANFYRVMGTPEELILDFGLNVEHGQRQLTQPIKLTHRIVLNFYTAKKLLGTLYQAVNRHESLFGVIETDFNRRIRTQPATPTPPPQKD